MCDWIFITMWPNHMFLHTLHTQWKKSLIESHVISWVAHDEVVLHEVWSSTSWVKNNWPPPKREKLLCILALLKSGKGHRHYGCTQPQNVIVLHEEEADGHTQGVKWKPFMSTFGQKPYCCPWVASGRLRTCQFSCLGEVVATIYHFVLIFALTSFLHEIQSNNLIS